MDPFQSLLKPGRSVIFYLMFPTHWPHASTQPYSPWRHFEMGFYQPTIRIYMLNSIQCWWTRCSYSVPPKLCFDSNKGTVPASPHAAVAGPIDLDPTVTDTMNDAATASTPVPGDTGGDLEYYCELRNVTEMRWGLGCDGRPAPRVPSGVLNGGPLSRRGIEDGFVWKPGEKAPILDESISYSWWRSLCIPLYQPQYYISTKRLVTVSPPYFHQSYPVIFDKLWPSENICSRLRGLTDVKPILY